MSKEELSRIAPASRRGAALARRLVEWYERCRRHLPWHDEPTPYKVWVSEVMLQQTRVEAVIGHYHRFLERFPDMNSLARASVDDVLAAWSGLGYYRRARSLHAGVRSVVAQHRGEFPRRMEDALALPGVGPYTAGAILSIAYEQPVPAVDGNVERVLTRLLRWRGDPRRAALARRLREQAAAWIPPDAASSFNQAIMELGATICTPRSPRCGGCPVADFCAARQSGDAEAYPEAAARRKSELVALQAAVVRQGGRILLERVTRAGFLEGLWLFPFAQDGESIERSLSPRLGVGFRSLRSLGSVRHSITFRRITVEAHLLEPESPLRLGGRRHFRWARIDELGSVVAVPSLAFKIAGLLPAR